MRTHTLLFLLAIIGCILKGSLAHRNHVVGSSLGWTVPPNKTFYQDWARRRQFAVGERLVFPYKVGVQNVLKVTKEDFDNCTQFKVIERYHHGPLVLELTKPGPRYYYCGIGLRCEPARLGKSSLSTSLPKLLRVFLPTALLKLQEHNLLILFGSLLLVRFIFYVLH